MPLHDCVSENCCIGGYECNNAARTMRAMNNETAVHAARAACEGKTFATDPEAFKELEAAKVRRNLALDPLHYEKTREAWHAKRRGRAHA